MPWFVGLITALMGAAAMALGIWVYTDAEDFKKRAIIVEAEVLSVEVSVSETSSRIAQSGTNQVARSETISYFPTVAFVDESGVRHEAASKTGSGEFDFAIGTIIDIGYDPDDLSDVRVVTEASPFIALIFFLTVGGLFFTVGMVFFIGALRGEPDHHAAMKSNIAAFKAEHGLDDAEKEEREPTVRRGR